MGGIVMKKEEAIKFLSDTKVYVDGKSKEIQEKLFKLDFKWDDRQTKETIVNYVNQPFLFINVDMFLGCSNEMTYFMYHKYKEIKVEDILSITIDEECKFKPFDRVLVRDSEYEDWRTGIYSHTSKDEIFPFITINSCYKHCLPYEGNEHLVGTNNSPKK